ncbi:hypothetical protein BGZ46_009230 [Entomortierella lignicola]|nr:hypothetical protein BGZ46_009230 [Entomortierella lignicola]
MPMSLSVSVPITSGPSSLMINSPTVTSNNIFTSTGASGFGTSHHLNEDVSATGHHKMSTAAVMASLQSQHSDVIHPASPKRQRHDSIHQQHHALAQLSPGSIDSTSSVASVALSTGAGATAGATMASMNTGVTKRPRRSSTSSSRTSTGSHLDLSTDPRASKVAKTSASSSAPVAASGSIDSVGRRVSSHSVKGSGVATAQVPSHLQHHAFHASQSHAQLQHLSQSVDYTQTQVQAHAYARSTNSTGSGNITHPRRAAQNRAAQRTFRNRRKAYIKDMEQKVLELNQTRSRFEAIQNENREIWGRYRALESLVAQNGLSAPQFPPMTPFFETEAGIAAAAASYTGPAGTANTSSAAEAGTSNQANKVSKVEESETSLLGHQVHYKQSSSERSDDDQDEDDTHEFNQDLGDYTITSTSQRQQQQQRQRQRMDTHVQDLDIRRQ